jgi:hypothetical protein
MFFPSTNKGFEHCPVGSAQHHQASERISSSKTFNNVSTCNVIAGNEEGQAGQAC